MLYNGNDGTITMFFICACIDIEKSCRVTSQDSTIRGWQTKGLILLMTINWLVVLTILKNMKVNGKDDIAYTMENKNCLKPPTSQCM